VGLSASKVDVWNRALDRIGSNTVLESEDETGRPEAEVCERHYDDCLRELLAAKHWRWATRLSTLTLIAEEQSQPYTGTGAQNVFSVPFALRDGSLLTVTVNGTDLDEDDYTLTLAAAGVDAYVTLGSTPALDVPVVITVTVERAGWENVFALPSDFVSVIGLVPEDMRYSQVAVKSRIEFEILPNDAGDGLVLCTDADADEFVLKYVAQIDQVLVMPRKFVSALAWRLAEELARAVKQDKQLADYCAARCVAELDEAGADDLNEEHALPPTTPSLAARG
jgi:hypothetical protein